MLFWSALNEHLKLWDRDIGITKVCNRRWSAESGSLCSAKNQKSALKLRRNNVTQPRVLPHGILRTTGPQSLRLGFLQRQTLSLHANWWAEKGRLTIGAPSSPIISNLVMYEFDEHWTAVARSYKTAYTRYVDDLYFSTNERNTLERILSELRIDLTRRRHPVLRINDQKTVFTSRKRRRLVTGLVLTSTGGISLGRGRKRIIKSLVYQNSLGHLDADQIVSLKGMLAFAKSVEPSFITSLHRKYDLSTFDLP